MHSSVISIDSITKRGVWPAPRSQAEQWRKVEVVLKIASVCNLDCDYCYFFHGGDNSHEEHPNFISSATIHDVVAFLARTARESDVQYLQIDFHGGEPLMLQKHKFEKICMILRDGLSFVPNFQLAIQTNGTLLNDEWIDILGRHDVAIGMSLDGSKENHDRHRVDKKGVGSYDDTVRGLRLVQRAHAAGKLKTTAAVSCVVSEEHDPVEVIRHLVDDLQVYTFNLVIPMRTHDNIDDGTVAWATRFLVGAFEEWVRRKDKRIHIRFIDRLLSALVGGAEGMSKRNLIATSDTALTIASNGELGASDEERVTATYAFGTGHFATGEHSLTDFYGTPGMRRYLKESATPAKLCNACVWRDVCRAGDGFGSGVERYSSQTGMDNPSVYCAAYKEVLVRMTRYALAHGVSFAKVEEVLNVSTEQAA